jgi:hypothetical protein
MITYLKLIGVNGLPKVRLGESLPPLRVGDKLTLRFKTTRHENRRKEELVVDGKFRVTSNQVDLSGRSACQILEIEATLREPTWVSLKSEGKKLLAPARSPATSI